MIKKIRVSILNFIIEERRRRKFFAIGRGWSVGGAQLGGLLPNVAKWQLPPPIIWIGGKKFDTEGVVLESFGHNFEKCGVKCNENRFFGFSKSFFPDAPRKF